MIVILLNYNYGILKQVYEKELLKLWHRLGAFYLVFVYLLVYNFLSDGYG